MACNRSMKDTDKQLALYVMGSLGVVAAVVCLLAVTLLLAFKLHNHFAHRLALYQALAAFCFGVILALQLTTLTYPDKDWNDSRCMALGFFLLYFMWLQLLFTSWAVLHFFCLSVFYKSTQRFEVLFIMFIVAFPLLFIWVPFIEYGGHERAYGKAGAWCWIKNWKNNCIEDKFHQGIGEQFGLWFVPAVILSLADSIAIVVIFSRLLCCLPNREQETLVARAKRVRALTELLPLLIIHPLIFCFLLIPSLINRFYDAFANTYSIYVLMIAASFVPLQPLLVGIASFYVCVLKFKHKLFRKHRPSHRTCTFATERPTNYVFADGDSYSYTRHDTQAICPNESEVDRLVLVNSREAGIQIFKPYASILT